MLLLAQTSASPQPSGSPIAPPPPAPCGFVEFVPFQDTTVGPDGTAYEWIRLVVHFPDGSIQAAQLNYRWMYPDKDADPFINMRVPAVFQFPPNSMRAGEPPLVQYVMANTKPDGTTLLRPCR